MGKTVLFTTNYGRLELALYLAQNNSPMTLVIPDNHDLFKYYQAINEKVFHNTINLIYVDTYHSKSAKAGLINKILNIVPNIIRKRRHLKEIYNKYLAELEGYEVFFYSRSFCGPLLYLLKKLSKRNTLVYIDTSTPDWNPMLKYTPTNIIHLVSLIIGKLTYGRDISLGKLPHVKGFLYIPDRFIRKQVDRVISREEINEMTKDFDLSRFRVFDAANHSVIYFDQPVVETGWVTDQDTYRRELTQIFDILSKHFPEKEIARKYRPNFPSDKTLIKVGDVLPDFIPAEFLYNDNVKMYLVVGSTSVAKLEKGLAVSVLNLVTFDSDKLKEHVRKGLIELSHSEILFPQSLDEFEQILIDLTEKGK